MEDHSDLNELRQAAQNVSQLAVKCEKCSACCENGLVYVFEEEKDTLEALGVPLMTIDGVHYIRRNKGGACPMLDRDTGKCRIYEDRPVCCRLYPIDIFNRNGRLEWGVYEYCPLLRKYESALMVAGNGHRDYGAILQAARMLEEKLGVNRISYLAKEDSVSAQREILDHHKNDYTILGDLAVGGESSLRNVDANLSDDE